MPASTSAALRPALSLTAAHDHVYVREIAVVGPGVVGLPMAALLATAELWAPDGTPTRVTVVQRPSTSSGWKVGAINAGRSPIGALEPAIDELVAQGAGSGRLRATTQFARHPRRGRRARLRADGARGNGPRLHAPARGAARRGEAPCRSGRPGRCRSSSSSPRSRRRRCRRSCGRCSRSTGSRKDATCCSPTAPAGVTRGGIVERLASTDKLVGTLSPETGPRVAAMYARIVTRGTLHCTNATTAEVREDARECLARRPARVRRGSRALLRRAGHRLLRRAAPRQRATRRREWRRRGALRRAARAHRRRGWTQSARRTGRSSGGARSREAWFRRTA